MKTRYVVVDDFYETPYEVRNKALDLDYFSKAEGATYPGANSNGYLYDDEIHKKIENILNVKLEYPKEMQAGYFRISGENDNARQDIHIDPNFDIGGVLFLNPPNQCQKGAGTSFWEHNILKTEIGPRSIEEVNQLGFPDYDTFIKEMIYGDCLDRSKWSLYSTIPYKFNRLVLFDSYLWHSHGFNFGKTKYDSRLVQLFFYKIGKNND